MNFSGLILLKFQYIKSRRMNGFGFRINYHHFGDYVNINYINFDSRKIND